MTHSTSSAGTPVQPHDPQPQPPPRPSPEDCCRSGCVPCVFDLYEEALARHAVLLKAWQARQAHTP